MQEDSREMMLRAEDMACSSCAGDMERILRETAGILDAAVSFGDETVHVRYDPAILDRKQVYAAVRRLGYPLKILSEK